MCCLTFERGACLERQEGMDVYSPTNRHAQCTQGELVHGVCGVDDFGFSCYYCGRYTRPQCATMCARSDPLPVRTRVSPSVSTLCEFFSVSETDGSTGLPPNYSIARREA